MADSEHRCTLCGDPIASGEAWMTAADGSRAHSGCVYREAEASDRDRWMPPETDA